MPRPESVDRGAAFDLNALELELRREDAYQRDGHAARTLVRESDLRVVLMVMRAGARIAEHRVQETASLQVLRGQLRLGLSDRSFELGAGQLLALQQDLPHDVEAPIDAALLLTIGWRARA